MDPMVDEASSLEDDAFDPASEPEPVAPDDHAFTPAEVAELAGFFAMTPAEAAEVVEQKSKTRIGKKRRLMLLKLLVFLRQTGH